MMKAIVYGSMLLPILLAVNACKESAQTCVRGASAECSCPSGAKGAQICDDKGALGVCLCDGAAANGASPEKAPAAEQPAKEKPAESLSAAKPVGASAPAPEGETAPTPGLVTKTIGVFDGESGKDVVIDVPSTFRVEELDGGRGETEWSVEGNGYALVVGTAFGDCSVAEADLASALDKQVSDGGASYLSKARATSSSGFSVHALLLAPPSGDERAMCLRCGVLRGTIKTRGEADIAYAVCKSMRLP